MSGVKLEDTGTMLLVCAIDLINKSQNVMFHTMTMFTMSIDKTKRFTARDNGVMD